MTRTWARPAGAGSRARFVVRRVARSVPWLVSGKPAAALALLISLTLGALQVSEAHQRAALSKAEADARRELARSEHDWALEREARVRREAYVKGILDAKSNSERLFILDTLLASASDEDRGWLAKIRGPVATLSAADASRLSDGQRAAQDGDRDLTRLTRERDAQKDQTKRKALDEQVRERAQAVASLEAELEPVRRRVVGTPSSTQRYLCDVGGTAHVVQAAAAQADDECRRTAQATCRQTGAQLCSWSVRAL